LFVALPNRKTAKSTFSGNAPGKSQKHTNAPGGATRWRVGTVCFIKEHTSGSYGFNVKTELAPYRGGKAQESMTALSVVLDMRANRG